MNVHASLLPRFRGAAPIQWAIASGDSETGVCLMAMDEGLDTGPTIACARTPIGPDDTSASLHERLSKLGADLLRTELPRYLSGELRPVPQPSEGVVLAPMIKKEDGQLDFTRPAAVLERRLRAFTPWPGAFTTLQGGALQGPPGAGRRREGRAGHGALRRAAGDRGRVRRGVAGAARRAAGREADDDRGAVPRRAEARAGQPAVRGGRAMKWLVLHGPNLNLLGDREGDPAGLTLAQLDAQLRAKARELGAELKILQSNHEGVLVDALHEARAWADGVVLNPGALSVNSYVLRDAIAAVKLPCIEVHLSDLRKRESWRRTSVLAEVCTAQLTGKGVDSYLLALERLAGAPGRAKAPAKPLPAAKAAASSGKTIGRKGSAPAAKALAETGPRGKTIGRPRAVAPAVEAGLTREKVKAKLTARLSGSLGVPELAAWARAEYLAVEGGGPIEETHRELLTDAVRTFAVSGTAKAAVSEHELLAWIARLDR